MLGRRWTLTEELANISYYVSTPENINATEAEVLRQALQVRAAPSRRAGLAGTGWRLRAGAGDLAAARRWPGGTAAPARLAPARRRGATPAAGPAAAHRAAAAALLPPRRWMPRRRS